jgi:phage terminase small subunit
MMTPIKHDSRHDSLTPKQAAFVQQYLVDLNATQAAIRAGYSARTADVIGHQLLSKTWVSEAIRAGAAQLAEKVELTKERIARELAAIGFAPGAAGTD